MRSDKLIKLTRILMLKSQIDLLFFNCQSGSFFHTTLKKLSCDIENYVI